MAAPKFRFRDINIKVKKENDTPYQGLLKDLVNKGYCFLQDIIPDFCKIIYQYSPREFLLSNLGLTNS